MEKGMNSKALKLLVTISFVLMVTVNALANILPINGVTTGAVSDSFPNLFAPAGITFAIWGLIYLLLVAYTIYQWKVQVFKKVGIWFIISSLANAAWIFSWQYYFIPLSMVLMLLILVSLIIINAELKNTVLTRSEKIFIRLPFSVYFGWITVATIANATALLVYLGWGRFGISQQIWTITALFTGLIISMAVSIKNSDVAYAFVILWAYFGILYKHLSYISAGGFGGKYPEVIIAILISLIVIMISIIFIQRRTIGSKNS